MEDIKSSLKLRPKHLDRQDSSAWIYFDFLSVGEIKDVPSSFIYFDGFRPDLSLLIYKSVRDVI